MRNHHEMLIYEKLLDMLNNTGFIDSIPIMRAAPLEEKVNLVRAKRQVRKDLQAKLDELWLND